METSVVKGQHDRHFIRRRRSLLSRGYHMSSPITVWVAVVAVFLATIPFSQTADIASCAPLTPAFPDCVCRPAIEADGTPGIEAELDCSNRNLNAVPVVQGNPLPTQIVIKNFLLNGNSISTIGANSFQGIRVENLDLSDSQVSTVEANAFTSLAGDLKQLQLDGDGTNAASLNKAAFQGLSNIESITLRKYNIEFIGDSDHIYFLGLSRLKSITLDNCKMVTIENDAFQGTTSLTSLTITNEAKMINIPSSALTDTQLQGLKHLKISNTGISEVPFGSFANLGSLEELDISENAITKILAGAFNGLGATLKKLSLAGNTLVSGVSDMSGLKNLPNVEELDLSGNENINQIPDLSQMNTAEQTALTVVLHDNKLTNLPGNAFNGIAGRLTGVILSKNKITSIDDNAFAGTTRLQTLDLSLQSGVSGSGIILPTSLSQSSNTLKTLILRSLPVQSSAMWSRVGPMKHLKHLDLRDTRLSSIPDLALKDMTLLEELLLDQNSISSVTQASLVGPRNSLKLLSLAQTPVRSFPSCTFSGYTSFPITLGLASTSLVCDCSLGGFVKTIESGSIIFQGQPPTCSGSNRPLTETSYNNVCPNTPFVESECPDYYNTGGGGDNGNSGSGTDGSRTLQTSLDIDSTSITISWSLSDTSGLRYYDVKVTNAYADSNFELTGISKSIQQVVATPLRANTRHTVCVFAVFSTIDVITACTETRTHEDDSINPGPQSGDDDDDNTGIIIGAIVGSLLLFGVIAAIVYLGFLRRRPKKQAGGGANASSSRPVQPRTFAKSELPSMTGESRTFTRQKRPLDNHDGMQVVAISDGQMDSNRNFSNGSRTSNGSVRVGRAEAMLDKNHGGSYKVMRAPDDNKSRNSLGSYLGGSTASGVSGPESPRALAYASEDERWGHVNRGFDYYENDHGPLPKTPTQSPRSGPKGPGYYNEAFEEEKYEEIPDRPRSVVTTV